LHNFNHDQRCGEAERRAEIGVPIEIVSNNFPAKMTCGVNCMMKLIAPENAKIIVKWYGFVLDGCHQGNALRIVDGPKSKTHCGDKIPGTYVSVTNMVEIAITAVQLGRKDKGIIYKFTYEAIPGTKRSPAVSPAGQSMSIRNRQILPHQNVQNQDQHYDPVGVKYPTIDMDYSEDFSFGPPLVRPAGSSKKPRPQNNYKLTSKELEMKELFKRQKLEREKTKEETQFNEKRSSIFGPVFYMIAGIMAMIISISCMFKIIYCKKKQIQKTEKDIEQKLSNAETVHTFRS